MSSANKVNMSLDDLINKSRAEKKDNKGNFSNSFNRRRGNVRMRGSFGRRNDLSNRMGQRRYRNYNNFQSTEQSNIQTHNTVKPFRRDRIRNFGFDRRDDRFNRERKFKSFNQVRKIF